jgi:hypothetical protein
LTPRVAETSRARRLRRTRRVYRKNRNSSRFRKACAIATVTTALNGLRRRPIELGIDSSHSRIGRAIIFEHHSLKPARIFYFLGLAPTDFPNFLFFRSGTNGLSYPGDSGWSSYRATAGSARRRCAEDRQQCGRERVPRRLKPARIFYFLGLAPTDLAQTFLSTTTARQPIFGLRIDSSRAGNGRANISEHHNRS